MERAGRPDTPREGLPPLVEGRVRAASGHGRRFDPVEAGRREKLAEVVRASARSTGLVLDVRIDLPSGLPERTERPAPAGEVPDARRDDAAHERHPRHLAQASDRIGHEMDNELRTRGIEGSIGEGECLGRRLPNVDSGMTGACRGDERLGRVDGRHRPGPKSGDKLRREGAWTTAHVERALPDPNVREVEQPRREQARPAAHEAVVRFGVDVEGHGGTVPARQAPIRPARAVLSPDITRDKG